MINTHQNARSEKRTTQPETNLATNRAVWLKLNPRQGRELWWVVLGGVNKKVARNRPRLLSWARKEPCAQTQQKGKAKAKAKAKTKNPLYFFFFFPFSFGSAFFLLSFPHSLSPFFKETLLRWVCEGWVKLTMVTYTFTLIYTTPLPLSFSPCSFFVREKWKSLERVMWSVGSGLGRWMGGGRRCRGDKGLGDDVARGHRLLKTGQ